MVESPHMTAPTAAVESAPDGPLGTSLLLDLGVPFRIQGDAVYVEEQAHNGLQRWLENFERITVCAPILPDAQPDSSMRWTSVQELLAQGRLRVAPFPWSYDLRSHIRNVGTVRQSLRSLISQHRYLCFSNLGWLGAWGSIAAEEAYRLGRPYAVWLDWVLHEMPLAPEANPLKGAWRRVQRAMQKRISLRDIRRASLGLFHGRTVFDAYEKSCKVSRVVHDIHLGVSDIISVEQLHERFERKTTPVKIVYLGRVHPMKGPRQWLETMQLVLAQTRGKRDVHAQWVGDGPMLEELRAAVAERGLADYVSFAGVEMDRGKVLGMLRDADLFVFCHLTPESPRCLIEALMSGLPILGFESPYAADLLNGHAAGGELVPLHDTAGLSRAILACIEDPARARNMAEAARAIGTNFSDVIVFRHRSDLIKEFL
jgi:colanic acid/amylovoran biosynthesis glycosyltransferase